MHGDGRGNNGLQLRVTKRVNGELSKSFHQRVRLKGKPINVPIGPYPIITLKEARDKALENGRLARKGSDPRPSKKDEADKKDVPTFDEAAELVIAERRARWKEGSSTEIGWRNKLRKHAFPKIGHKRVDEITEDDIIDMLKPLWESNKQVAGKALLNCIKLTMEWCKREYRELDIVNPVTDFVRGHFPKTRMVKHIPSVPYYQVGKALRAIREYGGWPQTKLAQETQILTATRHMSIRKARWDEIDWDNKVWTSPDESMKMGRAHRVPLSTGMMEVLAKALPLKREDSDLIFPGQSGEVMGHATLPLMCQLLNLPGTPHGFRATFATWCADKGVPQELAEAALAHTPNAIVQAYTRTDYMERRKPLMQAWSDYIEGKLDDDWKWREGDDDLIEALRESQRQFAEAQRELGELRDELRRL